MSDVGVFPRNLRPGDTVRVVAPARSRAFVLDHDHRPVIAERFAALGLQLSYGEHVDEGDDFDSSPSPQVVGARRRGTTAHTFLALFELS